MKKNGFKVTIERLDTQAAGQDVISFETYNHDDLIALSKRINATSDEELSRLIGIKLFGEAMLDDRKNPLYEEIFPAFKNFMKRFKESAAATASS